MISLGSHTIFAFSDTHGHHRDINVPEEADIIICAGDAVEDNLQGGEYDDFIDWFSNHKAKWKIFVPGNHELSFELERADAIEKIMSDNGITVLQNAVEDCDGVVIGSVSGNVRMADDDIPTDIDILITHYLHHMEFWTRITALRKFCTSFSNRIRSIISLAISMPPQGRTFSSAGHIVRM